LFPANPGEKLAFNASVRVLPLPAAEDPAKVTVHWLLATIPVPSMILPEIARESPLSGTM